MYLSSRRLRFTERLCPKAPGGPSVAVAAAQRSGAERASEGSANPHPAGGTCITNRCKASSTRQDTRLRNRVWETVPRGRQDPPCLCRRAETRLRAKERGCTGSPIPWRPAPQPCSGSRAGLVLSASGWNVPVYPAQSGLRSSDYISKYKQPITCLTLHLFGAIIDGALTKSTPIKASVFR